MSRITPYRAAIALLGGAVMTCVLYLLGTQPTSPLRGPEAKAVTMPGAATASASVVAKASGSMIRRIVVRHPLPGDVVFTLHGEELQIELRAASMSTASPPPLARSIP